MTERALSGMFVTISSLQASKRSEYSPIACSNNSCKSFGIILTVILPVLALEASMRSSVNF